MIETRYQTSFTIGGLYRREALILTRLYLSTGDWVEARNKTLRGNLLQSRTASTAERICREVVGRLNTLKRAELVLLDEANPQDQVLLLWVAVCRRYRFIGDFAVEVLYERFSSMRLDIPFEEFDAFYNRKAEWYEGLDSATQSRRTKIRQVLFRMLREAGLLDKDKTINAVLPSPRLVELLRQNNLDELLFFPLHKSAIARKGMPA